MGTDSAVYSSLTADVWPYKIIYFLKFNENFYSMAYTIILNKEKNCSTPGEVVGQPSSLGVGAGSSPVGAFSPEEKYLKRKLVVGTPINNYVPVL